MCMKIIQYKKSAVVFVWYTCVCVHVYIRGLDIPLQSQAQPTSLQGIPISSHLSSFTAAADMPSTKHSKVLKHMLLSHQCGLFINDVLTYDEYRRYGMASIFRTAVSIRCGMQRKKSTCYLSVIIQTCTQSKNSITVHRSKRKWVYRGDLLHFSFAFSNRQHTLSVLRCILLLILKAMKQ